MVYIKEENRIALKHSSETNDRNTLIYNEKWPKQLNKRTLPTVCMCVAVWHRCAVQCNAVQCTAKQQ